jgi:prevent-host-death family protein
MRSISASEAKQNFAALVDAAQREPVVIRRHNRDVAVLISVQDFEEMWRPKAGAPRSASGRESEQLLTDEESDG